MRHVVGNDREDTVVLTASAINETAKALLVRIGTKEKWVPKSVIHDDSEVFDLTAAAQSKLVVLGWWARKEGLG